MYKENEKRPFQRVCVTNRQLALKNKWENENRTGALSENVASLEMKNLKVRTVYLAQLERALQRKPDALILREKDLLKQVYKELAALVMPLCERYSVDCILNSYVDVAVELGASSIQMSYQQFLELSQQERQAFQKTGVSVHSVKEAVCAEEKGADYVIAGHIFTTDCKKGVLPRGLEFLETVCRSVQIPVYAIGGIHESNAQECAAVGAAGVCMMSEYMCL